MRQYEKQINKCIEIFFKLYVQIDLASFSMVIKFYLIIFIICSKNICTPVSEISVQCKYMLRVNIRTPLKMIFRTKNILGGLFRLSIQHVSHLLTVLNKKLNKTVILTCHCSMCIANESTSKYTCSHAPYTPFTSVVYFLHICTVL